MSVPFDDRHAAIQYSTPPTQNDAADGAFLSTTSSIANSDTATIVLDGRLESFCVLGGPTTGAAASATLSLNGSDLGVVAAEDGSTAPRDALICGPTSTTTPNTVVITSTSAEPFVLDGLAVAFR